MQPQLAGTALCGLDRALQIVGLRLNNAKTMIWSPSGRAAIPHELADKVVGELPVLGSHLRQPGDMDESPAILGASAPAALPQATARLNTLWQGLRQLKDAGLKRQAVAALLRSYAGPASQHALQIDVVSDIDIERYDLSLRAAWEELLERPLPASKCDKLGLPSKLGGAGVQWAATRRNAAYWSGWTAAIDEVRADQGCSSLASLLDLLPATADKLQATRTRLQEQGARVSRGAPLPEALASHFKQRLYLSVVQKKIHAAELQSLHSSRPKASFMSATGSGAGGFLQYPEDECCCMEDVHWSAALRQRLGMARAECSERELALASPTCVNRTAAGAVCGKLLDTEGYEATTCQSGGGVLRRHARLESSVGGLIFRWTGQKPHFEQRVPAWDRKVRNAAGAEVWERAVLDIEYTDLDNCRRWIDVSVRSPIAGSIENVNLAARKAGEAGRRGEREKHLRYTGGSLTAFIVESGGRLGAEARQWLRRHVEELPRDTQAGELNRAYKVVSCAVQSQIARQLRAAAGLT